MQVPIVCLKGRYNPDDVSQTTGDKEIYKRDKEESFSSKLVIRSLYKEIKNSYPWQT